MATAWKVAAATAVVGWLVSPVITLLLPKILSCLGFHALQKLEQLEIHIIPELEKTLRAVDQERIMQRERKPKSDVAMLDKMAAMLRHAREDAEDIVDDHQDVELYRNRWPRRLYGSLMACIVVGYDIVKAFITRCLGILQKQLDEFAEKVGPRLDDAVSTCKSSFMWWAQNIHVAQRSEDVLPVTTTVVTPVDEATTGVATSDEPPVLVAASSESSGCWFSCWCFIKTLSSSTLGFAYFLRDWPYHEVGITSHQEDASVLDSLLTAVSRRNLKKRIEKIESTVSKVKKSSLLGIASKSTLEDIANMSRSIIRTASNHKIFGREGLRDAIMAKLRETTHDDALSLGTSPCYSVIGIYGVAGSGKSTFARYIRDYIQEDCKEEKLFNTIMCIHVSESFSVDDIFHEMLTDITKDRHCNISDREELEEKLRESLLGKRFCLILDDLWVKTKNDRQLEKLISPLNVGLKGSKILVTARTKVAAEALCVNEPMKMPDLDEQQYLSMFMHYALGGTSVAGDEFERVGRVIAGKLHGSPIAAVIVAGQLGANRDIKFWKNTAEHDMFHDTMDALRWSYQQLSSDIKRCFEYCNIFPRRFKMNKDALVRLWIAQGFVKPSCAAEDMEAIAEGYIQELLSCSFLQQVETSRDVDWFRIHDLLHDLLDVVTRTDMPRDVRHLFIQNYDARLIEETLGLGNLRTLIINVDGRDKQVEEQVIDSICKKLPKLRVLAFSFKEESIMEPTPLLVPESVSHLKYLRYLVFRTKFLCEINLPSTVNKLQHIQLLDFGNGDISEFTFAELVNLRHMFCWPCVKLAYVGRLSSLQTLSGFKVSNEQGCELIQLRDLNKLRGKLHISGLENVKSKFQALEANLAAKQITDLSLWWGDDDDTRCSPEVEADVLDGLCPPVGLKKLSLYDFVGWRYPDWMVGTHSGGPKYLEELHLWDCSLPVPPFGLHKAFPHLCVLELSWCNWDALPDNMEHLTSLKELIIHSCENIWSLPALPQSLEKFSVSGFNDELRKSCQTVGHPNWQKIKHIDFKDIR